MIIGIALGTGISYWIYKISAGSDVTSKLKFKFPTKPIIISIIFIAIIVGIIMKYSLNKINKQRAKHYKYYTNRDWYNYNNYDLSINVDMLGVEKTAELIKNYLSEK